MAEIGKPMTMTHASKGKPMNQKTIRPEETAELYELADGETRYGWTRVGTDDKHYSRQSRWHNRYWLVLRDDTGDTWGLEYGIGLTEDQENDLPWEGRSKPVPLHRLYPHTVTRVEYREDAPEAGKEGGK